MNVGLSTPLYDESGAMLMRLNRTDSKLSDLAQFASRSSTLNGGSVIRTQGFFETNREIVVVTELSEAGESSLLYLFKTYPYLYFSGQDGFFLVVIETLEKDGNKTSMKILLKEKMS